MIKLLTIVGARPQFIKAAALSRVIIQEFSNDINEIILHTGQHYDRSMSDVFFSEMQIPEPAHNLDIGSSSHGDQTGMMIQGIEKYILKERPDGVIVYGDTNSTLAGSLAAARDYLENPPRFFPSIFGNGLAAREILNVLTTTLWR